MLKQITGSYFLGEQMEAFAAEMERMIREYGWQEYTIGPFGYSEPIMRYLGYFKTYHECTRCSKEYLIALANGMAPILNRWEQNHKERTVRVRIKTGKNAGEERMVTPWMAEDLLEDDLVEIL